MQPSLLYVFSWSVLYFVYYPVEGSGPCALLEPRADALCIPLASINRAFRDARQYFGMSHPLLFPPHKTHFHLQDVDTLGMVLGQTTQYLAKEFQLSKDEVERLLPQLDLELTDIWEFCPQKFKSNVCKLSQHREITGKCNNLNFPQWGESFTPFTYLLPPERPDGVDYPKDPQGTELPPARLVSSTIHRDLVTHDHSVTVMFIAWGQIIDHDVVLTSETKDKDTNKYPDCCRYLTEGKHAKLHHNCFPIQIPHNDNFYSSHRHHCMNFLRSSAGVRSDCRLGPRTALNSITSFLDASFLYGSNEQLSNDLRTGEYGMLKSLPSFHKKGLKDLLPLKFDNPDDGCIRPNNNIFCFLAGDGRVNEQLVLTVLHVIFMRMHNNIAHQLAKLNPHWKDERIYQETRKIIIAITQHITYKEFLPLLLGKNIMESYKISIKDEGQWDGYDPNVDPSATEEFVTSAFRFGHSLLPNRIERWSYAHHFIDSTELSHLIRQPFDLFNPGHTDTYILGMVNQLAQAMDEGVTEQVTTLLFRQPQKHFGMDLASMNIQRGRDHAIRGYPALRTFCGFSPINHWDDIIGIMTNETVYKYKSIYSSPHDIDLWSGGVSEIPNYGAIVGPTFSCIIAKQFQALRYGDRHWYELPSSFTQDKLEEIKKIKLSRILCDNGDFIKSIQVYPMAYPDPSRNPRVPCQGSVLPRIDLTKWQEELPKNQEHYHHSYQDQWTLHPPKFDSAFLNKGALHNLSHETTIYQKEPGNEELVESFYKDEQNPPSAGIDPFQNDNLQQIKEHFAKPEILETLEPPEILDEDYELILIHNKNNLPPSSIANDIRDQLRNNLANNEHYSQNINQPPKQFPLNDASSYQGPPAPLPPISFPRPIRKRRINQFPKSPFPFLGGIFSPNPGYLVKQQFSLPRFAHFSG